MASATTTEEDDEMTPPYDVKCHECRHTIRWTNSVRESAEGGTCEACRTTLALQNISRKRKARGICHHCGDPVPCRSEYGDQRVGVRHSTRSHAANRRTC